MKIGLIDADLMDNGTSSLKNCANKMSIVFHNSNNNEVNILMTGDITRGILEKLIKNDVGSFCPKLHNKYKYIKAPHHGTDTHFTPLLPDADTIFISNGLTDHKRFGKISYQYGAFYGSHKNCRLFCTNERCELIGKLKSRCLSGCKCRPASQVYELI